MERYISITKTSEPKPKKARIHENVSDPNVPVSVVASTSTLELQQSHSTNVPKFQYLFNRFYKLMTINGEKLTASCEYCPQIVSASTTSSGNLLSHIKKKHSFLMPKVEDARREKNQSSNITQTKIMINDVSSNKVSKQKIKELVFNYIVNEMCPLITCEKKAFWELIIGLTGLKDTSMIPDRRQMRSHLKSTYAAYVEMLTHLIKKHNYICMTADIWSTNNKSYMGMTCHVINNNTYQRESFILGCKRMKGSHDYLNIAEVMTDITDNYRIDLLKITHTVTDNASNFGKSFQTFSKALPSELQSNSTTMGNFNEDDDVSSSNSETDGECSSLDIVNVDAVLSNPGRLETSNDSLFLPPHITCYAHSLNLIATHDISTIEDNKYKKMSESTFQKLSSFWNICSRSTVAADKVLEICGCKFPVPVVTRWNSLFDASKKILIRKTEIVKIFEELKLTKINKNEWTFLEEYCTVMEPLAICLDKMQCEKKGFLGYVAPIIQVLRRSLIMLENLKFCRPLCFKIIHSLEKRFNYLFDLSLPKSRCFILASISHPKFKLSWIPPRYMETCKKQFLDECYQMYSIQKPTEAISESDSDLSDGEFYSCLQENNDESTSFSDGPLDQNNFRSTNVSRVQALNFLNSKKKDLCMLENHPIVKQVFLKFNTTIPSSAPVERLLSGAIQVLTPRRNRLSDKTFEMLLCCKSNKNK